MSETIETAVSQVIERIIMQTKNFVHVEREQKTKFMPCVLGAVMNQYLFFPFAQGQYHEDKSLIQSSTIFLKR